MEPSPTEVVFYREDNGEVQTMTWLRLLPSKVQNQCLDRLDRLATFGNNLRRPMADFLRDGIYELRTSHNNVQYRMLYFFGGKNLAVVSHGIKKKGSIPPKEIDRAISNKKKFQEDSSAHSQVRGAGNEKDEVSTITGSLR